MRAFPNEISIRISGLRKLDSPCNVGAIILSSEGLRRTKMWMKKESAPQTGIGFLADVR